MRNNETWLTGDWRQIVCCQQHQGPDIDSCNLRISGQWTANCVTSDHRGLSLERRAPLLLTWGSEIENHNLQIMSTLAKECGAKSQDGFTKARLTEFMPPSFDCQYKTLQQSSTARIYVRLEWIKRKISQNQSKKNCPFEWVFLKII